MNDNKSIKKLLENLSQSWDKKFMLGILENQVLYPKTDLLKNEAATFTLNYTYIYIWQIVSKSYL